MFKSLLVEPRTDVEGCYALPVEVKRWEGFCRQRDAMAELYPKIVDSDAIINGFPIYTSRENARLR